MHEIDPSHGQAYAFNYWSSCNNANDSNSGLIVNLQHRHRQKLMTQSFGILQAINIGLQVILLNKDFYLILYAKAILDVMPIVSMEVKILFWIMLRLTAHLPKPIDYHLVLYFYQDLPPKSV